MDNNTVDDESTVFSVRREQKLSDVCNGRRSKRSYGDSCYIRMSTCTCTFMCLPVFHTDKLSVSKNCNGGEGGKPRIIFFCSPVLWQGIPLQPPWPRSDSIHQRVSGFKESLNIFTHISLDLPCTQTHTRIYIYIYYVTSLPGDRVPFPCTTTTATAIPEIRKKKIKKIPCTSLLSVLFGDRTTWTPRNPQEDYRTPIAATVVGNSSQIFGGKSIRARRVLEKKNPPDRLVAGSAQRILSY